MMMDHQQNNQQTNNNESGSSSSLTLLYFERKFYEKEFIESRGEWIRQNWHLSFAYAFVYIVAVFAGQAYMKSREKFDLRRALIAWNLVLSLFSLLGAVRLWPEFVHTIYFKGVDYSICDNHYTTGVNGGWVWLFILSKVPELFDTLFIVMRKQQLIFLHWYHHATVLVYCWFSGREFSASGRWFVIMNYTIHAAMYAYYAFRALRFNIPKWINMMITSGQISQMVIGIYVNTYAYVKKQRGESCDVSYENIKWSFIMYFSYFLLFFHFFYRAYLAPKSSSSSSSKLSKKPSTKNNINSDSNTNKKSPLNSFNHQDNDGIGEALIKQQQQQQQPVVVLNGNGCCHNHFHIYDHESSESKKLN